MKHLVTVAAVAVALAGVARGVPPPTVSWQDASHYVGEIVTVEGDVAEARTTGNTCVLEFAPDDPRAFRAILLLPLLTSLPQHPEQLYRGRRVKVSGDFHTVVIPTGSHGIATGHTADGATFAAEFVSTGDLSSVQGHFGGSSDDGLTPALIQSGHC